MTEPPAETGREETERPLSLVENLVGLGAFVAWCLLFNIGNTVGSYPFLMVINSETASALERIGGFLAICLTYTPLNVLGLSLLAGCVGRYASRVEGDRTPGETPRQITQRYILTILGAFMIYLMSVAGVLAILGFPFELPKIEDLDRVEIAQSQYRKTAALCSFFSLVEGARPFVLQAVAGRIQAVVVPRKRQGKSEPPSWDAAAPNQSESSPR
jgi:hypothetical protein